MDFHIVKQMPWGSLIKNKLSKEIKELFRNEISQKLALYIEHFKRKQFAVLNIREIRAPILDVFLFVLT